MEKKNATITDGTENELSHRGQDGGNNFNKATSRGTARSTENVND